MRRPARVCGVRVWRVATPRIVSVPCARGFLTPQTPQTPQTPGQRVFEVAGFGMNSKSANPANPATLRALAGFAGFGLSGGGVWKQGFAARFCTSEHMLRALRRLRGQFPPYAYSACRDDRMDGRE